jgi:hypothetical protein
MLNSGNSGLETQPTRDQASYTHPSDSIDTVMECKADAVNDGGVQGSGVTDVVIVQGVHHGSDKRTSLGFLAHGDPPAPLPTPWGKRFAAGVDVRRMYVRADGSCPGGSYILG